jgi:hypothetical protein
MRNGICRIALVAGALLLIVPTLAFAADPQPSPTSYRYQLNEKAYANITFEEMYGNIVDPAKPGKGITMEDFFGRLITNVGTEAKAVKDDAYKAKICMDVASSLQAVKNIREKPFSIESKDYTLNKCAFRILFDGDWVKKNYMVTLVAGQPPVNVFSELRNRLLNVEATGLTIPCNLVHQLNAYDEFKNLVRCESFWHLMGPSKYPDFLNLSIDDAENAEIEVVQHAVEVGLFGMMQYYRLATDSEIDNIVNKSESRIQAAEKLLALARTPACCCNQITHQCQPDGISGHNCSMCGSNCCVTSTKCPLS